MQKPKSYFALLCCIVTLVFSFLPACSKQAGEPTEYNSRTIQGTELRSIVPGSVLGKSSYQAIDRNWMLWYYPQYQSNLAQGQYGVVKWDGSFSCTAFTTRFCADAQLHYFGQSFQASNVAPSIAVGEFWYIPQGSSEGHAIVIAITQNGKEYFEPQTGKFVTITATEENSAFLRKFD